MMRYFSDETSIRLQLSREKTDQANHLHADCYSGCLHSRYLGRVAATTMKDDKWPEEAVRYCTEYRGSKLYVIVTETSIGFSTENRDQFMTISALRLFEEAFTLLLEDNSLEDLAGLANTCSMCADDLPRITNDAIIYYLEHIDENNSREETRAMADSDKRREQDVKRVSETI